MSVLPHVFDVKGAYAVITRTETLKSVDLPDHEVFDISTHRPDDGSWAGIWMIVISPDGAPCAIMTQERATRLAAEVRYEDPALANQIVEHVEQAKRYSKSSS